MAGGCFTDDVLHSSRTYHQDHATEARRLPKTVAAAWGVVILHFHGVANLYKPSRLIGAGNIRISL